MALHAQPIEEDEFRLSLSVTIEAPSLRAADERFSRTAELICLRASSFDTGNPESSAARVPVRRLQIRHIEVFVGLVEFK